MQKTVINKNKTSEQPSEATTPLVPSANQEKRPLDITAIPDVQLDSKVLSPAEDEIKESLGKAQYSHRAQDLVGLVDKLKNVTIMQHHFIQKFDERIPIKEMYRIGPKIASGSFSTVRIGISKTGHKARAIKSFRYNTIINKKHNIKHEIAIHSKLDHPNIINFHGFYEDRAGTHLVLEIVGDRDLQKYITTNGRLTENTARKFMKDIFRAVLYLHANNIMHRDIKPENFVVDESSKRLKLIDFGQAIEISEGQVLSEREGTPMFMSPELIKQAYGKESDIWSCGIVMFIMLSGQSPFICEDGCTTEDISILNKVLNTKIDLNNQLWDKVSSGAKDLLSSLL